MGGGPGCLQCLLGPCVTGVDHMGAGRLVGPRRADHPVPVKHVAPIAPHQRCKGTVSPQELVRLVSQTLGSPPQASVSPSVNGDNGPRAACRVPPASHPRIPRWLRLRCATRMCLAPSGIRVTFQYPAKAPGWEGKRVLGCQWGCI